MGRKRATSSSAVERHNAEVRQRHAELIDAILARRPGWSRAKLADVGRTYGSPEQPGLDDILTALRQADAFAARFGGGSHAGPTVGDFPISIDTLGRTYYRTGKLGTNRATGEISAEYEADNHARLWANLAGTKLEHD